LEGAGLGGVQDISAVIVVILEDVRAVGTKQVGITSQFKSSTNMLYAGLPFALKAKT
jgi:hypothetical protein